MFTGDQRKRILGVVGDAAQNCPLPSSLVVVPKRNGGIMENIEVGSDIMDRIVVGSFYEINHSKLLPDSPDELQSRRVVMVTAETEQNVIIRYPSSLSLERFFANLDVAVKLNLWPATDERYAMVPKLAAVVIRRQISSREFQEHKYSQSFWLIDCYKTEVRGGVAATDPNSKYGSCFSKLQNSGIKGWGARQTQHLVSYVPVKQLDDADDAVSTLSHLVHKESPREEERQEPKVKEMIQYTRKRKCARPSGLQSKKRKVHFKQKPLGIKPTVEGNTDREPPDTKPKIEGNSCEQSVDVKPNFERQLRERKPHQLKPKVEGKKEPERVERWSVMRYEVAVKELVEVLKANNAVLINPISRLKLRTEARKRIGDTGLLDHLLKHLAGKVVPTGGVERLRRRCDAEGKMEYWLESADLINIRKEAGVKDPYWTPPPGWKPGDCISPHSCNCCKEVMLLKDELNSLRRQVTELKVKDENQQVISAVLTESAASSGRFCNANWSMGNSKDSYELLVKKKSAMEEQLFKMSQALTELEGDMKKISSKTAAEANRSMFILPYSKSSPASEINEMNRTSLKDLPEEMTEESSESDEGCESDEESDDGSDYEAEREVQPNKRLSLVRLKQCRRLENMSNSTCDAVDSPSKDLIAVTPSSASPHSTTTS